MTAGRVLFVSSIQTAGGGEEVLHELVAGLGMDAVVAAPAGDVLERIERVGTPAVRLRTVAELGRATNRLWALELVARVPLAWIEIGRCVRKVRPDLVHVNNLAAAIYALVPSAVLRVPRVWHIHDVVRPRSWEAALVRMLQRFATRIVVPSRTAGSALEAIGVPQQKITLIHSGVDTTVFDPDLPAGPAARAELGLRSDSIAMAVIGSITPGKGTDVLLDALSRLPDHVLRDLEVVLVGEVPPIAGDYADHVSRRLATEPVLGHTVHLAGRRKDVARVLAGVDLVAQPSVNPESFGRSVAEGMAMEKVVIVSRAGALSELVEDGVTGFVCAPDDAVDLATTITRSFDESDRWSEIGSAAREVVVSRFDARARDELFRNLYAELTGLS